MSESQRREVPAVQNLSPAHSVLRCGCERRSIDGGGSRPSMPRRRDHSPHVVRTPCPAASSQFKRLNGGGRPSMPRRRDHSPHVVRTPCPAPRHQCIRPSVRPSVRLSAGPPARPPPSPPPSVRGRVLSTAGVPHTVTLLTVHLPWANVEFLRSNCMDSRVGIQLPYAITMVLPKGILMKVPYGRARDHRVHHLHHHQHHLGRGPAFWVSPIWNSTSSMGLIARDKARMTRVWAANMALKMRYPCTGSSMVLTKVFRGCHAYMRSGRSLGTTAAGESLRDTDPSTRRGVLPDASLHCARPESRVYGPANGEGRQNVLAQIHESWWGRFLKSDNKQATKSCTE